MAEVLSLKDLEKKVLELKKLNKKIILTNGCFDILHVGHIRYLRAAKALDGILVVAVNSDKSVKKLKGNNRPIVPEDERLSILSSLEMIDFIVKFSEDTVENVIKAIKPDIHAKGTDYKEFNVPEKHLLGDFVGEIKIIGEKKNHSTKDIINIIKEKFKE